jgi:hypothetical protein
MTWLWGLLAAAALFWPSRLSGALDGIPLDTLLETVSIGLLFPALWWFDPAFLSGRTARALIVALLAWKAITAATLVQDGWCVRLTPSRPYVEDGPDGPAHSWDLRADWRQSPPACTAIMTRPYERLTEFPAWFFNLPPAQDQPGDRPPGAVTRMDVTGYLTTRQAGVFRLVTSAPIRALVRIDDRAIGPTNAIDLPPGVHRVAIEATLTGKSWILEPLWNDAPVFRQGPTVAEPTSRDRVVRPWGRVLTLLLAGGLLFAWTVSAALRARDWRAGAWTAAAAAAIAWGTVAVDGYHWHWLLPPLAASCLIPIRPRLRNGRGMFLLVGVPWLAFIIVMNAWQAGRFSLYAPGNDSWLFQRFAYRIFFQGFWLEGGEKTFWFQPLYRWIAGALHLVFGDSSIGEAYLDGAALLVMAAFSFRITRAFAGFRWGLVAAVATLTLFLVGPGWIFIGHGLSEIASAGFIYLGALFALRSRGGSIAAGCSAGICATLAALTRLNNLPMASAIVVFAWPIREPISTLAHPSRWFSRFSARTLWLVAGVLACGLFLFAVRTWHYTGYLSVFHGTAMDPSRGFARRTWQPGMTIAQVLASMYDSVMMVLTTSEPPRVHNGALPLIASAVIAVLAGFQVPRLRRLPAGPVILYLVALASALVAKGTAYPGRFSTHVLAVAATIAVCTAAMAWTWLLGAVTRRTAPRLTDSAA